MAQILHVTSSDGDWEELWIEGECYASGHSISTSELVKILGRFIPASTAISVEIDGSKFLEDNNDYVYEEY